MHEHGGRRQWAWKEEDLRLRCIELGLEEPIHFANKLYKKKESSTPTLFAATLRQTDGELTIEMLQELREKGELPQPAVYSIPQQHMLVDGLMRSNPDEACEEDGEEEGEDGDSNEDLELDEDLLNKLKAG